VKRYIVSRDATVDLDSIWDYIAERAGAETATEYLWKFYETFRSIASSPRAGVNVPDLPRDVRKFPMGNYLIYYRALPGKILIARVLHGKRVQKKALRRGPA
jgi:toxin ParE1/3/4